MLLHNHCFSWDKSSFHFLPFYCRYIQFLGFFLKHFEQKPHIKWPFSSSEEFYLLWKIQDPKLLIQVLTKFPDQPLLFSQNHSGFFSYFFYQNSIILSKGCENRALIISLSYLYSRTSDGSDSAPAKIIKGKLQYPHNATWAENGSVICFIYKPAGIISYAHIIR